MSQFSSHENASLEKTVEVDLQPKKHDISCLETLYEIDKCSIWIQKHNFQNVCLQFPSHMLPDAAEVALQIEKNVGNCVYIIGDSSYEGCCIDYVAAEHINSDAIIHYGYSCFSQLEDRIPVLTILEKKQVDLVELFTLLNAQFHESVCVVCDKPYVSLIDGLNKTKEANIDLYKNITIVIIQDYNDTYTSSCVTLFITHGERAVRNLHNHFKIENLFYFDPENDKIQFEKFAETNAAYKRRFFLMEAIKDAQTVGIVVATMSVKNYLEIINRMKKLCKLHNKKSYILSVGKPNIAKFANFPEIDIFVIIACPQNNIYDSRDFYKPVVAPFDVELALNPNRTDHFNVHNFYDYNEILSEDKYPLPDKLAESDSVDISLISGKVRRLNTETDNKTSDGASSDLVVRDGMQVVLNDSHGAGYLFTRSWKGLEQKLGEDQPKVVEIGRKGIASKYENETS